jgi:predicted HTH domain antitoxin
MADVTLRIPREVVAALRFPPDEVETELRKELALALYRRQAIALGPARELAGLTRWEFEELLASRKIQRQFGEAELREDIAYGLGSE